MRRIIHIYPPNPHLLSTQHRNQIFYRIHIARHHHRRRTINRCHRQPTAIRTQTITHLTLRQTHRRHRTPTRQHLRNHRTTQRHHQRTITQRQTTRHHRSRNLTLRMTHHRIRLHTKRTPQPRKRHHHRPQNRLHHILPVQRRRPLHTTQHINQPPRHKLIQRRSTLTQPLRKHRRRIQQLHRHPQPLRTLPRKNKNDAGTAMQHAGSDPALSERAGCGDEVLPVADDDRTPV